MNRRRILPGPDHLRHLVRAVAWQPVLAGGAVAMTLASDGFRSGVEQTLAAVAVAAGYAFVLDDRASVTVATSPAPLWWRRAVRIALVLPIVVVMWLIVVIVDAASAPGVAVTADVLEVATFVVVGLAAAAVASRHSGDGLGGAAAGPVLLAMVAVSLLLPPRWHLYPVVAHQWRWVLLLAAALVTLPVASRDPATRGRSSGSQVQLVRGEVWLGQVQARSRRR